MEFYFSSTQQHQKRVFFANSDYFLSPKRLMKNIRPYRLSNRYKLSFGNINSHRHSSQVSTFDSLVIRKMLCSIISTISCISLFISTGFRYSYPYRLYMHVFYRCIGDRVDTAVSAYTNASERDG